jgi:hypothetical protein
MRNNQLKKCQPVLLADGGKFVFGPEEQSACWYLSPQHARHARRASCIREWKLGTAMSIELRVSLWMVLPRREAIATSATRLELRVL